MAGNGEPGRLLLATLIVLTIISGLVDAVSYLGLGHVFTANMTGNVVLLGFAAAGASGFSAPACLTSLGAFVLGAAAAGRIARRLGSRRHLLAVAMTTEAVATGAAAAVAFAVSEVSAGGARFTIIAVLAFGMGVRNATIRRLAVPDLTTTVLTMTLTGLAADSALAGGDNRLAARRAAAVAAMLLARSPERPPSCTQGPAATLLIGSVAVLAAGLGFWAAGESRRLDRLAS
jgi:uncharacterized membrane protein YoaK (UPF0700 family)